MHNLTTTLDNTPVFDTERSFRDRISSLEFQLSSLSDEKELLKLQYEQTVRELETKVKEEGARADKIDSDKTFIFHRHEVLKEDLEALRAESNEYQSTAENTIKNLRQQVSQLQDQNIDLKSKNDSLKGSISNHLSGLKNSLKTEQEKNRELQSQLDNAISELSTTKTKEFELQQKVTELQDQSSDLKHREFDAKSTHLLQTQLSDQLEYITRLEHDLSKKTQHIQKLEDDHKVVSVIEEEKQSLKRKLEMSDGLRTQLVDCEMRLAELQSVKAKWDSFLLKDEDFNSPEDLVRELMTQRSKNGQLMEQVARLNSELQQNTPAIEQIREEIDKLEQQREDQREKLVKESEARVRLQKQKELAVTEIEFLRGQLKSYESEETALIQSKNPNNSQAVNNNLNTSFGNKGSGVIDLTSATPPQPEQVSVSTTSSPPSEGSTDTTGSNPRQNARIKALESLVSKYRNELGVLSKELEKRDGVTPDITTFSPLKRKLTPFSSGERVAELTRKARSLQVELDEAKAKLETQEKELVSTKKQVELLELSKQLKEQKSAVRILELEDNPAARHEKVKQAMITALRKENEALLEQISDLQSPSDDENRHNQSKLVPYSSLERLQNEIQQLNNTIADQTKRTERLKQVFSKKSLEFREAVYSLLGYKVDLLPNKKIRATSMFSTNPEDESFVFIPDPKSLKASNGAIKLISVEDGPLTNEYDNLVTFWIKERKDIPCFLSAVNLELYDKTTKAASF